MRFAGERDAPAVHRLAKRSGSGMPKGTLLVADVGGTLLAARSLANGDTIADPYVHSEHLVELLALRSAHLRGDGQPPPSRLTGMRGLARRWTRSYS